MLAEAATNLPKLVNLPTYGTLLESLMVEALIQLADQKVVVKSVMGQEAVRGMPTPRSATRALITHTHAHAHTRARARA